MSPQSAPRTVPSGVPRPGVDTPIEIPDEWRRLLDVLAASPWRRPVVLGAVLVLGALVAVLATLAFFASGSGRA